MMDILKSMEINEKKLKKILKEEREDFKRYTRKLLLKSAASKKALEKLRAIVFKNCERMLAVEKKLAHRV